MSHAGAVVTPGTALLGGRGDPVDFVRADEGFGAGDDGVRVGVGGLAEPPVPGRRFPGVSVVADRLAPSRPIIAANSSDDGRRGDRFGFDDLVRVAAGGPLPVSI